MAGTWYPTEAGALRALVEKQLAGGVTPSAASPPADAEINALIAPHAGLIYSGPVAAHAYQQLRGRAFDAIVLIGPSHYVPFEGVSVWPEGGFETPLGTLTVDADTAARIRAACPLVHDRPEAHRREHSLEMQLPFLAALLPDTPIVPLVMGYQTRDTAYALADGLAIALGGRNALLVASSDLSHFFPADTASVMDRSVIADVEERDAAGLMTRLEQQPAHACGGGPMVAVLRAAVALGTTESRVLHYADSGDVSGDKSSVVGYLAAALWH